MPQIFPWSGIEYKFLSQISGYAIPFFLKRTQGSASVVFLADDSKHLKNLYNIHEVNLFHRIIQRS